MRPRATDTLPETLGAGHTNRSPRRASSPEPSNDSRAGGLGLAALLLVLATPASAQFSDSMFERHDVATGRDRHQTVVAGFFLDGPTADLAVVRHDGTGEPAVRFYSFQGGAWSPAAEVPLPADVKLVDSATIDGHDRLIVYRPGRIDWVDPGRGAARNLSSASFDFTPPEKGGIPYADILRDLNGDGQDDLVLPGMDRFTIRLQVDDAAFTEPLHLGPPEPHLDDAAVVDDFTYREMGIRPISIPWYLDRVHRLDFDRDGRDDLAFWNAGRFEVHFQDETGRIAATPEAFSLPPGIDSDGEYSLQYGFDFDYSRQTAIRAFRDLDGDGIVDLVTMTLEGEGLLGKYTIYGVHFGTAVPGATTFPAEPDTTIRSEGIQRGLRLLDVDGDGDLDLKLSTIELGVFRLLRAFVTNSFTWGLDIHRLNGRQYTEKPVTTRRLGGNVWGKKAHSPSVLLGDINADGLPDLMVGNRNELLVFHGLAGDTVFASRPVKVAVEMPWDDESSIDVPYRPARLVDLDLDGKLDIVAHLPSDDAGHRVTILRSR